MLDMGVEDYLLTSTVNGILAQRLVRKLDQSSMRKEILDHSVVKSLKLDKLIKQDEYAFYKPGASESSLTGYSGRMSILEFLEMSDPIRRLIMKHATAGEIQQQACIEGMTTIYEDGLLKCLDGRTSYEEILRVSQDG
jgi:general secretion pathway protein E